MAQDYQFPKEHTYTLKAGECCARIVVNPAKMAKVHGPRFDHLGVVRQVSIGGDKFLHPAGLGDEFGIHGDGILGYGEKGLRDEFLKIGVGRFKNNTQDAYTFWVMYPLVEAFPIETEATCETLSSIQKGALGKRYGYSCRKSYRLRESGELTIDYELSNSGTHAFSFEHYNHNWIKLADNRPDEHYLLSAPFDYGEPPKCFFKQTQKGTQLLQTPKRGNWAYHASEKAIPKAKHTFTVTHTGNGKRITCTADHPAHRFALYSDFKGFCPETFFQTSVQPGKTVKWQRTYQFEK